METLPTTDHWHEQYLHLKKEYEEFAYIVSHDLKAPLRAISNLSGWISEDLGQNLNPEIQHNIQLLQNRSDRMEGMINAILAFSRVERLDLDVAEIDVQAVVERWAAQHQMANHLHMHIQGLPTFKTYALKLESVLDHLLNNAAQFNQNSKPQIWVSGEQKDNFYEFTVKDNGIGIADEAQEKIFKLFYTAQPKESASQLGVGLTLAQKTIRFVGGAIRVSSALGKGSTFTFTWPVQVPATM